MEDTNEAVMQIIRAKRRAYKQSRTDEQKKRDAEWMREYRKKYYAENREKILQKRKEKRIMEREENGRY